VRCQWHRANEAGVLLPNWHALLWELVLLSGDHALLQARHKYLGCTVLRACHGMLREFHTVVMLPAGLRLLPQPGDGDGVLLPNRHHVPMRPVLREHILLLRSAYRVV
jgi:hypothetical protein